MARSHSEYGDVIADWMTGKPPSSQRGLVPIEPQVNPVTKEACLPKDTVVL